jgi:hypothetical protein
VRLADYIEIDDEGGSEVRRVTFAEAVTFR